MHYAENAQLAQKLFITISPINDMEPGVRETEKQLTKHQTPCVKGTIIMSDKQSYESVVELLKAKPAETIREPSIAAKILAQEGEYLYARGTKDLAMLIAAGMDKAVIDNLPVLSGAARYAESTWCNSRGMPLDAQEAWNTVSNEANTIYIEMLDAMMHAYRNNPAVLKQVRAIADGTGNADKIQDLDNMVAIARANPAELQQIKFDVTLLDKAAEMAPAMASALGKAQADSAEGDIAIDMRNRAYTALVEAISEVRNCGKYAFRNNPKYANYYAVNYLRRAKGKRNGNGNATAAETQSTATAVPKEVTAK
jgi:hypothetical protein